MRRGWRTRAGRTGPQGRHAGGHQRRLHGDGVRGPDDARDDDGPRLEQLLRGVDRRAAGAPASPAGGGGGGWGWLHSWTDFVGKGKHRGQEWFWSRAMRSTVTT